MSFVHAILRRLRALPSNAVPASPFSTWETSPLTQRIVSSSANHEVLDFRVPASSSSAASSAPSSSASDPPPLTTGGVLLTCEHADNLLPDGIEWDQADEWIREMHWAYDPGVSDLTRELAVELEAVAVLSKVSRLYVDVNRPVGASTLCRAVADGQPVHLNAFLNEPAAIRRAERARRIAEYGEDERREG